MTSPARFSDVWASDFSKRERTALADLLLAKGPDAPTLCEGWTTRDLAVHLVVREARPDAAAGMFVKPLAAHLERVTENYGKLAYEELIERYRQGPPLWSPMKPLDRLINVTENFVHLEDVRRAGGGETAHRDLSDQDREVLWFFINGRASMFVKNPPFDVVLEWGKRSTTIQSSEGDKSNNLTLKGDPQDLLLWLFGRDCALSGIEVSDHELLSELQRRNI